MKFYQNIKYSPMLKMLKIAIFIIYATVLISISIIAIFK